MIDEVHTLVGAGNAEGAIDASQLVKPALARGELQVLGATTFEEYRKHVEKDAALERRFQPVKVGEPSVEAAIEILHGLRKKYEKYHQLEYTDGALEAAVKLSDRYINDRFLPDKAIDLIDEAASKVTLGITELCPKGYEMNKELMRLVREKDVAIRNEDFKKASLLSQEEEYVRAKVNGYVLSSKNNRQGKVYVTADDIAQILTAWTKVPVQNVTESEGQRLLALEENLRADVVGQDDAVVAVSQAIRRARTGMQNPDRPIASFMFVGTTGVGKTELAKILARYFFGSEDSMIRFDMSEFSEKHTVSRLVGAPPGYMGFDSGGELTNALREKPYTIVLFDEVEKAHPDVYNLLLQVLDEGHLMDGQGRSVDCRNILLILTTNLGSKVILDKARGRLEQGLADDLGQPLPVNFEGGYSLLRGLVYSQLEGFFRPEFINRLDDVVIFKPLKKDSVEYIVRILLKDLARRADELGISIEVGPNCERELVRVGFDLEYGARPLRRSVAQLLEDTLSEHILSGDVKPGNSVIFDVGQGKLTLSVGDKVFTSEKLREMHEAMADLSPEIKKELEKRRNQYRRRDGYYPDSTVDRVTSYRAASPKEPDLSY